MARPRVYTNPTKLCVDGKRVAIPAYSHWRHIMERAAPPYHLKYPTYRGVTVAEDWLDYDTFYPDITSFFAYGEMANGRLFQLDKDLLFPGNKVYSRETCILLPPDVNVLLTKADARRGDLPIGVSLNQGRYMVTLSYNGKNRNLGRFDCVDNAATTYITAKECLIKEVAEKWKDHIDPRAYAALLNYRVEV